MSTEVKTPVAEEQPLALRTPRADEAGAGEVAAAQPHGPRRILVLGATSGIAEACIRLWANRGDALYLVARNEDKLAVVAADARMTAAQFQAFYPQWEKFARYKDPALTSGFWERVVGGQLGVRGVGK